MKKLVITVTVIIGLVSLVAIGCTNRNLVGLSPGAEEAAVNTCVSCHTNKDILKKLASPEEETKSAETTGEG